MSFQACCAPDEYSNDISLAAILWQALQERYGKALVVLCGLLCADEVHVNKTLEGYNFVGTF